MFLQSSVEEFKKIMPSVDLPSAIYKDKNYVVRWMLGPDGSPIKVEVGYPNDAHWTIK